MEKVLSAKEVYRLSVDRTPQQTKATAKQPNSRTYFRAQYAGITFIVDQAFMDAFTNGEIAEVVLQQTEVQVEDALNPGQTKAVARIGGVTFATRDQLIGAAKFDQEIKTIEHPELNKIVVTDDQLAQLQLLLKPATA